jgi:hypothetical protein
MMVVIVIGDGDGWERGDLYMIMIMSNDHEGRT